MKDKDGLLNGQVNEAPAISSILEHRPTISRSRGKEILEKQSDVYVRHGYTTIAATGLFPHFDGALESVSEIFGHKECPVRLVIYYRDTEAKDFAPKCKDPPGKCPLL